MKNSYKAVSLLLLLAIVACYKDETATEPGQHGPAAIKKSLRNGDDVKMIVDPERLHKITPQRAELIAVNAASVFGAMANTKSISDKRIASVEPLVSSASMTRSAVASKDTLMYAVNFSEDGGFALVSFDDRDGDILMYSENGRFDMNDILSSDNPMKFHVDMIMAYQQNKLNRIREAKAAGIEYAGEMKMDTVSVETFDIDFPMELTENPYETVAIRAGMPGSGLPGGGSGMPGMPGRTTIPSNYEIIGWDGNEDVIAGIERKYGTKPRIFGLPVAPPDIKFNSTGVPGVDSPPCPYPPYCDPPIVDYNGYYEHYGARLSARYDNPKYISIQRGPLMTTYWDQDYPINKYCYVTRWFPGILPDTDGRVPAGV